MGLNTNIEWCDGTLNLWWGCTKISSGCKNCYAEKLSDQRYKKGAWGPDGTRTEVKGWKNTLAKLSKQAKAENRRLKVFCQSMSDVFEGPDTMGGVDSDNWKLVSRLQDELLSAILEHPELDFLLLTKRPENVMGIVTRHDCSTTPGYNWSFPDNLWIGTSVEDQKTADERIPHLLKIPAKVRFLSCEPLLGPVDLRGLFDYCPSHDFAAGFCVGYCPDRQYIHWVIVGGESGANARPMHPDWVRSLRDQCTDAGVSFFFKQWGEWVPLDVLQNEYLADWMSGDGFGYCITEAPGFTQLRDGMARMGKKRAGRMLNGVFWSEFPEVK